mgnify:CR=1 FL=1
MDADNKKTQKKIGGNEKIILYLQPLIGGMAEWSIAAVLKTVEGNTSGGSNPSSSATYNLNYLFIK